MIDQSIHYQSFLNYEADSGPEQPGVFQATINDIGSIYVMLDYELIANLKQNTLISNYIDVFSEGPIKQIISNQDKSYEETIRKYLIEEVGEDNLDEWSGYIENLVSQSICRILLRMQNYHHGGAFLITANSENGLSIKHKLSYDRLFQSIINFTKYSIASYIHTDTIMNSSIDLNQDTIPSLLYLNEGVSDSDRNETNDELKGAIRFIASLSCIDGLVVLSPNLEVKGFGAVIRNLKGPEQVYVSNQALIENTKLSATNPEHYGTRHRSMFAYCWNNLGSLGFVVSQDGDIRAITRIDDKLIVWENIKVQQFLKSNRLTRPKRVIKSSN
jgi:hypothetical protein